MDRRKFLGALAAAGLGGAALSSCGSASQGSAARRGLERVGVQLYTLRDRMQQDVEGTLRAVASIGYKEVETAGLAGLTPQQFRALLDQVGLVSPAAHVPITALRQELDATLASAKTVGQQWIIVPWLEERERTPAGYRAVAAELNRFGTAARAQGLRVGYHNHDFEFLPLEGGRTGFDILLQETDANLVDIELDLFWAVKAGRDPVELFRQHPGRFRLCHVKDMADRNGAQRMVDVGQGEIDFARIFAHAEQGGLRHFFVEHDQPQDAVASIRTSYQHLQQLSF